MNVQDITLMLPVVTVIHMSVLRKSNCNNCSTTNDNSWAKQVMAKVYAASTLGNIQGIGKDKLQAIKASSLRVSWNWPVSNRR